MRPFPPLTSRHLRPHARRCDHGAAPLAVSRLSAARITLALVLLGACLLWPGAPAGSAARAGALQPNPAARARVGLQIGHYLIEQLPEDQARLRTQTGGSGGGYREVDINMAVVQRVAPLLVARGVTVDILPATVPKDYRADAFVAIHCDATPDGSPVVRGYKLARYRDSTIPEQDDALTEAIAVNYAAATRLPLDPNVTRAMTGYYAFNPRRFETTIGPETPSTIVELGFLTNPADRAVLVNQQDLIAAALADGILRFLVASGAPLVAMAAAPAPAPPTLTPAPEPTPTPVPTPAPAPAPSMAMPTAPAAGGHNDEDTPAPTRRLYNLEP